MEEVLWNIIVILQIILRHIFVSIEHRDTQKNEREGKKVLRLLSWSPNHSWLYLLSIRK